MLKCIVCWNIFLSHGTWLHIQSVWLENCPSSSSTAAWLLNQLLLMDGYSLYSPGFRNILYTVLFRFFSGIRGWSASIIPVFSRAAYLKCDSYLFSHRSRWFEWMGNECRFNGTTRFISRLPEQVRQLYQSYVLKRESDTNLFRSLF